MKNGACDNGFNRGYFGRGAWISYPSTTKAVELLFAFYITKLMSDYLIAKYNMLRPFLIISLSAWLTGCGVVHLNAPADQSVRLLTIDAPAKVRLERTVWFKWWGGEPIDPPDTATIIKENELKEVRLYMTNTFVDGLCNVFPGMIGFPRRTLIVEGNR